MPLESADSVRSLFSIFGARNGFSAVSQFEFFGCERSPRSVIARADSVFRGSEFQLRHKKEARSVFRLRWIFRKYSVSAFRARTVAKRKQKRETHFNRPMKVAQLKPRHYRLFGLLEQTSAARI